MSNSKIKKIISDFSIYGFAPYLPKIASFFILPLITPFLTKEDFGVFGIILSYFYFMEIFYNLGLQVNLSNSFYKSRLQYKWLWRQLYGFWMLWGIIYSFCLGFILYLVIPEAANKDIFKIIFLLVTPILLFGPVSDLGKIYYQLNKKPIPIGVRSVLFGFLSVFFTYIFIAHYKLGYIGWFYSMFIVTILTNISWFYDVIFKIKMTPIFNFKIKTIRKALIVSLPIIPHSNAIYLLNQSDRIMMDNLKVPTGQVGLYNASYSVASIFESFSGGFTQTIIPYVYDLINRKKEIELRNLFYISQTIFFILVIVFSLIAEELVGFLFQNKDFKDMYPLTVLIVLSTMFKPMYMASSLRFFYFEKTKYLSLFSFLAGIINIILNLIFIPIYGVEAAAISTIIGYLFLSYSRFWSKEFKSICNVNYYPMFWLILSIIICIVCYFFTTLSFNVRFVILALIIVTAIVTLFLVKDKLYKLLNKQQNN